MLGKSFEMSPPGWHCCKPDGPACLFQCHQREQQLSEPRGSPPTLWLRSVQGTVQPAVFQQYRRTQEATAQRHQDLKRVTRENKEHRIHNSKFAQKLPEIESNKAKHTGEEEQLRKKSAQELQNLASKAKAVSVRTFASCPVLANLPRWMSTHLSASPMYLATKAFDRRSQPISAAPSRGLDSYRRAVPAGQRSLLGRQQQAHFSGLAFGATLANTARSTVGACNAG